MSATGQRNAPVGGETLLGQPVVHVNHGELCVEAHVAEILGLKENDVITAPVETDEAAEMARPQLAIDVEMLRVEARPRRRIGRFVALGLVLLALVWAVQYRQLWSREIVTPTPVQPAPQRAAAATVQQAAPPRLAVHVTADERGFPLAVTGPDPARTLAGFCAFGLDGAELRPLGVSPAPPPFHGLMLGHFEDLSDTARRFTVRMFLDPRVGRWRIGDGREPIHGQPPPEESEYRPFGADGPPPFKLVVESPAPGSSAS